MFIATAVVVGITCFVIIPKTPSHASHNTLFSYLLSIVSGTSASSPVLAGMVALVNAARIAEGKSPLGRYFVALFDAFAFMLDIKEVKWLIVIISYV